MALLLRIVSGSWADRSGRYWTLTLAGYALTAICVPALAVLVIPGAVALLLLLRVRRSMGDPIESRDETATTEATDAADRPRSRPSRLHGRLPSVFWLFAASSAATTAGLVTFAVISYHLTQDHVVPVAAVPLIYAAAMAAEALAALVSGWLFDRTRGRVLAALPLLVTAVPVLAFAGSPLIAITGVLLWGAARWSS
jgi:MFS family permease